MSELTGPFPKLHEFQKNDLSDPGLKFATRAQGLWPDQVQPFTGGRNLSDRCSACTLDEGVDRDIEGVPDKPDERFRWEGSARMQSLEYMLLQFPSDSAPGQAEFLQTSPGEDLASNEPTNRQSSGSIASTNIVDKFRQLGIMRHRNT